MHRIKIVLITLACFLLPYNVQAKDLTTLENISLLPTTQLIANTTDKVFWENSNTITTSYTISNNMNAGTFGPVTVNNGVTVTVGSGETWTVI